MKPAVILLLLTAGTMLLATAAQELVVDAPQITTDAASPAVEPQVLNDQPFIPEDVPGLGRRGGPQGTVQRSGKPPGGIPPGPPTNKPPIGGPNPDTPSDLPDFTDLPCIDTPDEFARAFVTGAVRCVSDNILVRIERDINTPTDNRGTSSKEFLIKNFINSRVKAITFWSYGNNAEKYLRIGRQAMKLGNFVDNPPPSGLQNGAFPGIQDSRNFAGMLEAIGYSSTGTDPKRTHFLVVTTRPDNLTPPVPKIYKPAVYKPTWANVVKYIEYYIRSIAANDPDAYATAKIPHTDANIDVFRNFRFDRETAEILQSTTFADLSGCRAECTYQDTTYGNITPANLRNETWVTPTIAGDRKSETKCSLPSWLAKYRDADTRFELTEPTIIKENDQEFCDNSTTKPWLFYYNKWKDASKDFGTNRTVNRALGLLVAQAYKDETDALRKTIVLRAYLSQSPAGSFNALFSGDGYTYTGNGGFVGATGTEIHTGEVAAKENVPYVFPSVRLVFFCLVDVDGNPYDKNICLEEVVGNLDIGVIKEYVGKGDWDIAEIK